MAEYMHGGDTVTELQYRFVWATKYRYGVLPRDVGHRVADLIREV